MSLFITILVVGILACAVLDFWQRFLLFLFKIPPSNWAMVGRWFINFLKTRAWVQNNLAKQKPVRNELYIGWVFHYLVAVLYAFLYFFLFEKGIVEMDIIDGVIFGIISVVVPWFFFMPAMGSGLFGMKTANPVLACILAFFSHTCFGGSLGLFFKLFY